MSNTRDQLIADAKSLPDLIAKASAVDPALAAALTGQAKVLSKAPLGAALAAVIAWAAAHFGLGWGEDTDDTLAGLAVLAGGYLTHYLETRKTLPVSATVPVATPTPATISGAAA